MPTGFDRLDAEFGGVRTGIVTEIAAHSGDGKSALAKQLSESCARHGGAAAVFYVEDPSDATAERQFAGDTGIDGARIGRLDLGVADLNRIEKAAADAASWAKRVVPFFEPYEVDEVLEAVDGIDTVGGAPLRLVVIDYLQLLGSSKNLEDDLARLVKGLHARSRERKFASVVTSQVATDVIRRGRERWFERKDISGIVPGPGDTEWSRRAEKACKAHWAVVRPGRWRRLFGDETAADDTAELHVVKQNFGPTGWVELGWDAPTARFTNL